MSFTRAIGWFSVMFLCPLGHADEPNSPATEAVQLRGLPLIAQNRLPANELFNLKFGFRGRDVNEQRALVYRGIVSRALTAELHFLKKVCKPSDEQFAKLHLAGLAAADQLGLSFADLNQKGKQPATWPDPNLAIAESLLDESTTVLPEDVVDRYGSEIQARREALRAVDAGLVVDLMDQQVMLDADQMFKLTEEIARGWQEHWSSRKILMYYPQYCALPTSELLVPHLSDLQRVLWSRRPSGRNVRLSWQVYFQSDNQIGNARLEPFSPPAADKSADKIREEE